MSKDEQPRARLRPWNTTSFYGLVAKGLNSLTGVFVIVLVPVTLPQQYQGYFFTFMSFGALYLVFDLGLSTVIQQYASHAWAHRSNRGVSFPGDDSELRRIWAFASRFYRLAALILFLTLQLIGYFLFGSSLRGVWPGPWMLLTVGLTFELMLLPAWSFLEGCGEIRSIYRFRASRSLTFGLALGLSLLSGLKMWALGAAFIACLPAAAWMLYVRHSTLTCSMKVPGRSDGWGMFGEIFPLQWRMGLSAIAGYSYQWAMIPIVMSILGSSAAGRFGIVWTAANSITAFATVVIASHAPQFSALVALRRYKELDRLTWKTGIASFGLAALGSAIAIAGVTGINAWRPTLAGRFLSIESVVVILLSGLLLQAVQPMATYLRAHKKEPYMAMSVSFATSMVIATIVAAKVWGLAGIPFAYLFSVVFVALPLAVAIFIRFRAARVRNDEYLEFA